MKEDKDFNTSSLINLNKTACYMTAIDQTCVITIVINKQRYLTRDLFTIHLIIILVKRCYKYALCYFRSL